MSTVTADIEVDVPVRVAYDQWTQFEAFPNFMSAVESIHQIDDTRNHWVVSIAGVRREFDADISDQVPDDHVAWKSIGEGEVDHRGRVDFRPADDGTGTRVDVTIEWTPQGFIEKAGAAIGIDDTQVKRDLHRFKEFIEERRTPTGEWRGEVHDGATRSAGATADDLRMGTAGAGAAGIAGATGMGGFDTTAAGTTDSGLGHLEGTGIEDDVPAPGTAGSTGREPRTGDAWSSDDIDGNDPDLRA